MKRMRSGLKQDGTALSKIVRIHSNPYASANVESDGDDIAALEGYIPGSSTIETVSRLGVGMRGGKRGRMISITGPYGSGKSTMGLFIDGLAAPDQSRQYKAAFRVLQRADPKLAASFKKTRGDLGILQSGMVRCTVMAQREPITVTILRSLDAGADSYFDGYTESSFKGAGALKKMVRRLDYGKAPDPKSVIDVISGLCRAAPVLFLIDEFGKNIEYFTDNDSREGDLFLLQNLAEMSGPGRKLPLFMITMQHMAFEEYAINASTVQRQEWAKVQGRFDDIPVANSPEQTRLLITNLLKLAGNDSGKKAVSKWARREAKTASEMGLGGDLNRDMLLSCYPIHPLVIEVLPEMCARYGQYERTLLSFVAGGGVHTVSRFIDENRWVDDDSLPTVGLDMLYDYFVSGSPMTHSASSTSRLMEIGTIIRDSHGLSDADARTLKSIGVLNLIGRTGRLRASKSMIRYATGLPDSDKILTRLEERSLITYRRHADEYRIWHGTDVDISGKLEIARRRLATASLVHMLEHVMRLDPVVAAKHAIETGTTRIFERKFVDRDRAAHLEPSAGYDGLVAYVTAQDTKFPKRDKLAKPVIIVESSNLEPLRDAAVEAAAIRDVLDGNPDISADWVARRELNERLAWAESSIEKAFEVSFGAGAAWTHLGNGRQSRTGIPLSTIVSDACGRTYPDTPRVFNEMINRNVLSPQGSTALKKLMEVMMLNYTKPMLGIDGWGPERAMYGAVLDKTGMHRGDGLVPAMHAPRDQSIRNVWNAVMRLVRNAGRRVSVEAIYEKITLPPYGAKLGYMPIILTAFLVANRDRIALYEHGTYCRKATPEIGERLVKNPGNFEIKYFVNSRSNRAMLGSMASSLGVKPSKGSSVSVLDIVGHLVTVFSQLPPHIKNTKMLSKDALAVRDAIASAREPDTLLFEAIPAALQPGTAGGKKRAIRDTNLAKRLAESVDELRSAFGVMLAGMRGSIFEHTGIKTREQLSGTASGMASYVLDKQMEVFLNAVSHDILDNDDDWIKYVALTVTDVPPDDWTDDQRRMFANRLQDTSYRLRRLASMHFEKVAENFPKPTYSVTVTQADGEEDNRLLSISSKDRSRLEKLAKAIVRDMKRRNFADSDIEVLAAILLSDLR